MGKTTQTRIAELKLLRLGAFFLISLATVGSTLLSQRVIAADGQALYGQKLCITCHGPEGKSPIQSTYPKLAGQNKEYLVQQVTDIQSGARNNGLTNVMKPIVANVTAEEIEAIAEYLSGVQ